MSFGQRLKQLREENGLSQIQFANQLGITEEIVDAFENDETMLSADMLVKLSSFYNMSIDELLGNTQKTELPIAKAQIVNSKKQIKQALKFESSVSRMVLLSIGIGLAILFAGILFFQSLSNISQHSKISLLFLIYIIPFFVMYIISIVKINITAKRYMNFMQGRNGYIEFYNNYLLVCLEGEQSPVSYSYSNFFKTSESDGYYLFYLQNKAFYCVDKLKSEGYIKSVSQMLAFSKRHKNKSALNSPNGKYSVQKLLRMKNASNILYTLSFFSLYLGLIFSAYGTVMNSPIMKFSFLFAGIIPLCGLIYGIYIKIRKFRGNKLIITSAIFLCLTLLYGSLFAFNPVGNLNSLTKNANVTADKSFSEIFEDLQSKDFKLEKQANLNGYPGLEQCYEAESPDSEYTLSLYEFSDDYNCDVFYSQIGNDLQYYMYSKRSYAVGNIKMLSITTESDYFYKCCNGEFIVSFKVDKDIQEKINETLDSLGLVY